ncbi:MAG: response regulator [Deltaproteobacteria bacterium]|nr:response regulator [Deltaproteobacteria bacterium]
MLSEGIVLQSAGSLSVAVLALIMTILQTLFFNKKPQFRWYAWSAAISFSALLYAVGIFIEYNTSRGSLNRFSGILEFTALICLLHSMYGFTFSYLGIKSKLYHPIAGIWHGIIILLLWFTPYIVSDQFVEWYFFTLRSPYIEPALGPMGPVFELYTAIAAVFVLITWFRHKGADPKHRVIFLAGMGFWILLGIHDGLVSMGILTFQYTMEYGFMGFAMVVLWVVFDSYLETKAVEKYRVITEFTNDCILVIQDGKTVFGNHAFCSMLGRPLTDSAAQDFFDIIPPEKREMALELYYTLLNGTEVPNPNMVSIQRSDGERRLLQITSNPIRYRNRAAILVIMRDVTEQKLEEEALRESEEKVRQLKKMESLGLLAGGVAHDLNNVLSGIITYPELILMNLPLDSDLRKDIETIKDSGNKAAAIVQDLLTVARGVTIAKEPLNLNDVVNDYLKSPEFEKLVRFHPSVSFRANLSIDIFNILGSHFHLKKTVMNLISNAVEAIDGQGDITISTMNRYVDRPFEGYHDEIKAGEYAILSISDKGPNLQPNDLRRIFEPFYTKKVMGRSGTGLGLTVVWNVVQDHEGYIEVLSNEKGTKFRLYFPITRVEVPEKDSPLPIKDFRGNGEMILVVDDVESQRIISCKILETLGYRTTAVSSGEEAVEYLKNHSVDLVVLDMVMEPGMDGRKTYEKIVEIRPNQKAIIVSGFVEPEEVKATQELGAGEYVKKPFTVEKLGIAVKTELMKISIVE